MLLIYPPSAPPVEPPLGISRLAGYLESCGEAFYCLDLNVECKNHILKQNIETNDTRSKIALQRRDRNISIMQNIKTWTSLDRVKRAINEIEYALSMAGPENVQPGLCDYKDKNLSPLKSQDLLFSAKHFQDNIFFQYFSKRIDEIQSAFSFKYTGISISFLSQALCAFAIAGYLRSTYPDCQIILGGSLINSWTSYYGLQELFCSEGIINKVVSGNEFSELSRSIGKKGYSITPDFSNFQTSCYFAPKRIIPYNMSYGCSWKRCLFCPEKYESSYYQTKTGNEITTDIELLSKQYQPEIFHFTDCEISPDCLMKLANIIPGTPWYGFTRFSPILDDLSFCKKLAASGCLMLQIGLESGDQTVLDSMKKGINLDMVDRILSKLSDAGIMTFVYIMFGTTFEKKESALKTIDFVSAKSKYITFLNVSIFNMPIAANNLINLPTSQFYDGDLSLYTDFTHPDGWNRSQIRSFLKNEFENVSEIKSILNRTPPILGSNISSCLHNLFTK